MSGETYVGVALVELHLPEARSLKAKRAPVRGLVERIRSRHQVLVIENGHQDLHQRARLAICALSSSTSDLDAKLQRVEETVAGSWEGEVLSWQVEILEI
jgi:uncharacterized protein YlxP (DUF503 family)